MCILKFAAAILGCIVLTAPAAWAQTDGNAQQPPDLFASNSNPNAPKRKTLQFVRVVMDIPAGQSIGAIYRDITCAFDSYPITTRHSGDLPPEDFASVFKDQEAAAGNGADNGSLFGEMGSKDPDLLVAAAITDLHIKVCAGETRGLLAGVGSHSSAHITVNWQVANGLERKIVFRATTEGQASVQSDWRGGDVKAMHAAFSQAAKALFALPEFQKVTTFSPEELAATAALSQSPAPTTTIPYVPLSSQSFQERLKQIQAQVVTIRTSSMASGSGFYIADGLLLTNHHVAAKGTTVKVHFLSGKEVTGLSIASNARRDVALIRTENVGLTGLPLRVDPPEAGTQDYAVGSPEGQEFEGTVSAGIVSAIRDVYHARWIQSDVATTHGSSGGPLLDANGNVIGMDDRNADEEDKQVNMNLFIPIAEALQSVGIVIEPPTAEQVAAKSGDRHKTTHAHADAQ